MQSMCRTWPPNGSSRISAEQKLHRKDKGSLEKFLEPNRKPKVIFTDNSWEFGKSCEEFSWNHCTSTPHRSETHGIAERAVRRVKEGTSAVLLQSGLGENFWADSMECYTYLRNIQDLLSDGKTHHERRFGKPFKGPIIPFGSLVEYYPISAKDQSRIHQFGKKSYLDCSSDTLCTRVEFGRVTYWSQTLRSWRRWTHRKSTQNKNQCKGSNISQRKWRIYFSNRRRTKQTPWRRSGIENIHLGTASTNSRRESH